MYDRSDCFLKRQTLSFEKIGNLCKYFDRFIIPHMVLCYILMQYILVRSECMIYIQGLHNLPKTRRGINFLIARFSHDPQNRYLLLTFSVTLCSNIFKYFLFFSFFLPNLFLPIISLLQTCFHKLSNLPFLQLFLSIL